MSSDRTLRSSFESHPVPYRTHFASHKPNQYACNDSKHHHSAALGQSVDLPSLQHRSEDERYGHPEQSERHVERQILLFAVTSVGGHSRTAAWPARNAVDLKPIVRAVVELGIADIDDDSVLRVIKRRTHTHKCSRSPSWRALDRPHPA